MTSKKCSKCELELSIDNFYPRKGRKTPQWASACKTCDRKRTAPKLVEIPDLIEYDEDGNVYHERWLDITSYEGIYQISDFGRVKRIMHRSNPAHKIINVSEATGGYLQVCLTVNGKGINHSVHRLVGIHFIPNPENKSQINHKKGNKKDNRFFMIEWNTSSENIIHAFDTGLSKPMSGTKHGKSKLTEKEVLEIRASDLTPAELAVKYNVLREQIYKILRRERWGHI